MRLAFVLLVAQTLMGTSGFFFNGVVNDAGAAVMDELRDWATLAQIVLMVLLAFIARCHPRLISLRVSVALFCAAELVGASLAYFGCVQGLAAPLVAGSCLTALTRAWVSLGFVVLLARLELWQTAAVLAVGNALAVPLAGLVSAAGYGPALACDALFTLALVALIASLAEGDFASMAQAEPAADAELTSPRAVLSLRHDLFVYTFLFCVAYGFGLRYENADGGLLSNSLLVALFIGIGAAALVQRAGFRADSLFEASFILALVGFLLVLLDDASLTWHASVALTASSEVFGVLMCLALAGVVARSRTGAFYTIAWGYAAYYAGIEVGALLGMYATGLGAGGTCSRKPWWQAFLPWCASIRCTPSATSASTRPSRACRPRLGLSPAGRRLPRWGRETPASTPAAPRSPGSMALRSASRRCSACLCAATTPRACRRSLPSPRTPSSTTCATSTRSAPCTPSRSSSTCSRAVAFGSTCREGACRSRPGPLT